MTRAKLAEIELAGGTSFQHNLPDLCRKVQRGKVVRVIHLQTGRHRAFFSRERPPGCEPVRITIYELGRAVGKIFDDIRDGTVYQIWNGRDHQVVGYLAWTCPPWLELLADAPMSYTYRARSGQVISRDIYPLHVQAEPLPPRRRRGKVLADA